MLSVFGAPGSEAPASQPPRMYLPQGEVQSAWRANEVPYAGARSRKSPAQKAGLAYQKRIGKFLQPNPSIGCSWIVDAGSWFAFTDSSSSRHYCQPDFLLLDTKNATCIIVEVKIRWTDAAWWQLERLYLPVLRRVYPHLSLLRVCICRSYDPAIRAPEEVVLCDDLLDVRPDRFNVLVQR